MDLAQELLSNARKEVVALKDKLDAQESDMKALK